MVLDHFDIKKERNRAKSRFQVKLLFFSLLMILGVVINAVFVGDIWPIIIQGLIMAHATQLMHQLAHGVYSNQIDRLMGFVLGLPVVENFSEYRISHIRHHKFIGTTKYHCHPDNQMSMDVHIVKRVLYFLIHGFKLVYYFKTLKRMYQASKGKSDIALNELQAANISQDYLWMMLAYMSLMMVLILFDASQWLIHFWLLPLLVASLVHTLLEFATHGQCDLTTKDHRSNSRTILAGPLIRWYSNNNCYHTEHHMYMNLPMDTLKSIHEETVSSLHNTSSGYIDFYWQTIKKVFSAA